MMWGEFLEGDGMCFWGLTLLLLLPQGKFMSLGK